MTVSAKSLMPDTAGLVQAVKNLEKTIKQLIRIAEALNENLVILGRLMQVETQRFGPNYVEGCTCPWNNGLDVVKGHHIDCPALMPTKIHDPYDDCGSDGHHN